MVAYSLQAAAAAANLSPIGTGDTAHGDVGRYGAGGVPPDAAAETSRR